MCIKYAYLFSVNTLRYVFILCKYAALLHRMCIHGSFCMHTSLLWVSFRRIYTFSPRTGWRRPIGCLKLQVIFRKSATNYRALLQKMTYEDKAPMTVDMRELWSSRSTHSHPTLALTSWMHLIFTYSRPTYSLPTYSRPTYSRPTFSRPDVLALMHSP